MTATAKPERLTSSGMPRRKLIIIFIGLILGILMAALDQTIVATAMPTIAGDLNGLSQISWIITAYLMAQTIAMPIYGKVGDLIGRKQAFQLAIVIFLTGSVVAGLSPNMGTLIALRAVQGVGAGGLMVGAQTIMSSIVSARERGKYMSVMGPMIGVATVLGPLLGGFLTDQASWRWIFYINIPIGIASLIITGFALHLDPLPKGKRRVDYPGAIVMAGAVTALMLVLTWGGRAYPWSSPTILLLSAAVVILGVAWIFIERRAAEPILPMHLFRDGVFRYNAPLAFAIGVAMFGAVSYLPTYLQLSLGVSPTDSGFLMLPLMGGLMLTAVITGQIMSRTGHYKIFPLIGTPIAGIGLYLLSFMNADSTQAQTAYPMAVLGMGIGFVMPTLVLAVQNSVALMDIGSATAGVNFFRQIGASLGTALIGSLFVGRLTTELAKNLPAAAAQSVGEHANGLTPAQLAQLPPDVAHAVIVSYADALTPLYAYVAPLMAVAFVVACFVKAKPLDASMGRGPQSRSPGPDAGTGASEGTGTGKSDDGAGSDGSPASTPEPPGDDSPTRNAATGRPRHRRSRRGP